MEFDAYLTDFPELLRNHVLRKLKRCMFLSYNWAPSVMCSFLENSEVSPIQNKDVAAAAAALGVWLTYTHALQSEPLSAVLFHLLLSGLMRATRPSGSAALLW